MDQDNDASDDNVVGMRTSTTVAKRTTVEITLEFDESSFLSHGRDAEDATVVILSDAVVWTEQAPAARVLAFSSGRTAQMLCARVNQDMTPLRAKASWDGVCWNIESIIHEAKAA